MPEYSLECWTVPPLLTYFPDVRALYIHSTEDWNLKGCFEWINMVKILYSQPAYERVVGVDLEWFDYHPVAVVQIASRTHCFVFHLSFLPDRMLPLEAEMLLFDTAIIKCGCGVLDDQIRLMKDCRIEMRSIMELQHFVVMYGLSDVGRTGLKSLTERLTDKKICKSKVIVRSNWEKELDINQFHYAVDDAVASLLIGQVVLRHAWSSGTLSFFVWNGFSDWLKRVGATAAALFRRDMSLRSRESKEKSKGRIHSENGGELLSGKDLPKVKVGLGERKGSVRLLDQNGVHIFSITSRRAKWYVRTGVATENNSKSLDGKEIQFTFDPENKCRFCPWDGEYCDMGNQCPHAHSISEFSKDLLLPRLLLLKNGKACTSCLWDRGVITHLIIPANFRKYLPSQISVLQSDDYVYLCQECIASVHQMCRKLLDELREEIEARSHEIVKIEKLHKCVSYAKLLLDSAKSELIPEQRKNELLDFIKAHWHESRLHKWSRNDSSNERPFDVNAEVDEKLLRCLAEVSPEDVRSRVWVGFLVEHDIAKAKSFLEKWRQYVRNALPDFSHLFSEFDIMTGDINESPHDIEA